MVGEGVNLNPLPPCGFSKNVSSEERVKSWFFVTFNIIISHILSENFIEIPQVVQKIWMLSLSILAIFIDFQQFFWIFWNFLDKKKLITSVYSRWCQHFSTFDILEINWSGGPKWNWHPPPPPSIPEKTAFKSPAVLGLIILNMAE